MSLRQRNVADIMQREVVTLREDDQLALADDIMRLGRVRHMPVLAGEKLVGLVSNRDLLAASLTQALDFEPAHRRAFMRSVQVREVMSKEVVSVGPGLLLKNAAALMIQRQIGCLPVVDGERLVGLVTETDLLRAAYVDEDDEIEVGGSGATRREAVSDNWKERVERELNELRRVRDELRVRVHLGKKDAQDLWQHLERRMGELESHAKRAAARTEAPAKELADASRHLLEELRRGYRELRDQL